MRDEQIIVLEGASVPGKHLPGGVLSCSNEHKERLAGAVLNPCSRVYEYKNHERTSLPTPLHPTTSMVGSWMKGLMRYTLAVAVVSQAPICWILGTLSSTSSHAESIDSSIHSVRARSAKNLLWSEQEFHRWSRR